MKKAIHLINSFKHGGAENVAINYSLVLKKLKIECSIIGSTDSKEFENRIIERNIGIEYKLNINLLKKSDYIFVHSNQQLLKLLKYFFLLKLQKKRVFYIQHLNYSESKFKKLAYLINLICTDFVQITPITSTLIHKYIKIKIDNITNFYINKYAKNTYSLIRDELRTELNIEKNKVVYMFSGVFKQGKGLKDFLRVAEYFSNNNKFIFLIAGNGQEADYVKNYPSNNIKWVGFQNDIERYLIASDFYLFTSLFKQEMLPMALIEAINTDKKILAYNTDINNFLLQNQTFASIEDMILSIEEDKVPFNFKKYDEKYAIAIFHNLLFA